MSGAVSAGSRGERIRAAARHRARIASFAGGGHSHGEFWIALTAATKTRPRRTAKLDTGTIAAPVTPFDCDTVRASVWFGSTRRCLDELCRGQNVTNAAVIGGDGRLRTNPCARGFDDRR